MPFFRMPPEFSTEREKELIDKIAKLIVDYGMEAPAMMGLSMIRPMSYVGTQLLFVPFAPFLEMLGIRAYEYSAFLLKRENLERIMKRVEELDEEKMKEMKGEEASKPHRSLKEKVRLWASSLIAI